MLKGNVIYLRLFELEDYVKTYEWHNDFNLQKSTCGPLRFVSKEIEKSWVLSKSSHNLNEIYLAICAIENDEMIGWYSITDIDFRNRKCHCSGVVIGDKRYRDGIAYQEAGDLVFNYLIEELNMNRITAACLYEQILARAEMEASFWTLEGIERQAVFKNGSYHDVCRYAILKDDYIKHLQAGDYENKIIRLGRIIKRLRQEIKNNM